MRAKLKAAKTDLKRRKPEQVAPGKLTLDPEARVRLGTYLARLATARLVLFSTHIPEDIAVACRRVLVLDQGRVRFDGATDDLRSAARGRVRTELVADAELRGFLATHRVVSRVRELDAVRVRYLAAHPSDPGGRPVEPTLEEAYIGLIEPLEPRDARG